MLMVKHRRGSPRRGLGFGFMTLSLTLVAGAAHAQDVRAERPADPDTVTKGEPAADEPAQGELTPGQAPAPPPDAALPEVEPIIPDEEFNAAVPALDPASDAELAAPLESIEEFERRLAGEEIDAKPTEGQAPPAGDAALADQQPVEAIGDAPIRDAELTQPLPPLDQFEVAPVQFAEDESDAEEVEVAYGVSIEGLDAADDESYDERIRADTELALSRTGRDVGTPILTFHPGAGNEASFFGPVISKAPRGVEAVELWDAVEKLATMSGMAELKRSNRIAPDFT